MNVADTSIWVEWLLGSSTGEAFRSEFLMPDRMIIPTMVHLELEKWFIRETADQTLRVRTKGFLTQCRTIPMDQPTATLAARFCHEYKLATADAVIYATAVVEHADLLTCDAHFNGLPGVRYIAKHRH